MANNRKHSRSAESEVMTVNWPEGERGSVRTPPGLRERISDFLRKVELETEVAFTRNEFVLNAVRFYLRYLLQARTTKELVDRLREQFEIVETSDETSLESGHGTTRESPSDVRDDGGPDGERQSA